jgi:hypothetical protein
MILFINVYYGEKNMREMRGGREEKVKEKEDKDKDEMKIER